MQKNRPQNNNQEVKELVTAALFCALAYVATLITAWIKVGFLTFDIKDAVIAIAGLVLGPIYTIIISLIVSTIEIIVIPETGFWGFLMNFLSTAAFSFFCALIYKYKKDLVGAIIGLVASIFSMTLMMVLLNLVVTPIYTGMPVETIAPMIPTLFLPFNFTKAVLNAALVLMLYKPVSRALKATKMTASVDSGKKLSTKSKVLRYIVIYSVGAILVAASICVLIFALPGEFTFFQ